MTKETLFEFSMSELATAMRTVIYTYGKTLKANLMAVVAAKDKDRNQEVPQLALISSACSSSTLPPLDTSLVASCCSPVESRLQELAILGDGCNVSGRGSGRLMMVSWNFSSMNCSEVAEPVEAQHLSPLESMNHGRVIVWCSASRQLIALGGESLDEFSLDKKGCWRRVANRSEISSPDHARKRQAQSKPNASSIRGPEAVAVGSVIYMVGGVYRTAGDWTWRYSLRERTWEALAPMKSKRKAFGLCQAGRYLIAAGGNNGRETLASIEVYDTRANVWVMSNVKLTRPRERLKATVCGIFLIIAGGVDEHQRPVIDFEGIHLKEVLQASTPTPCSICESTLDGIVLTISSRIHFDASLDQLELRTPTPPPSRRQLGAPAAWKKLWNGGNDSTTRSARTKTIGLERSLSSGSAELPELTTAASGTSESCESFDFVSEDREPDVPAKAVQQPTLAFPRSDSTSTGEASQETPPFVTPREVTWADEVDRSLVTIFEAQPRRKRRAPKKIREIHSRGVQTDYAFLYRRQHFLCAEPPFASQDFIPVKSGLPLVKPRSPRKERQARFIDPITYYDSDHNS